MTEKSTQRQSTNARLTRLIWRQRLKIGMPIALILLGMLLLVGTFALDPSQPTRQVEGTATGLDHRQLENPGPTRLVVQLDDGREVIVAGRLADVFRQGRRVLLQEYETLILGRRDHRFIRYLTDEPAAD